MTSLASPTATIDEPTSQGEVDEKLEHSHSNDADSKIPLAKDLGFLPIPRHLQYDPTHPFHFGLLLNIGFGFASTFSECLPFYLVFDWLSITILTSCCKSLLLSALAQ